MEEAEQSSLLLISCKRFNDFNYYDFITLSQREGRVGIPSEIFNNVGFGCCGCPRIQELHLIDKVVTRVRRVSTVEE